MSVELSAVRLVYMKADLKHTVDMQEVWNSEEAAMHKQNFLARQQVGTRMDTSPKRRRQCGCGAMGCVSVGVAIG